MKLLKEFKYGLYEELSSDWNNIETMIDSEVFINSRDRTFMIFFNEKELIIYNPEINKNFNTLDCNEISELYKNNPNLECFYNINIKNIEKLSCLNFNGKLDLNELADEPIVIDVSLTILKMNECDFLIKWRYDIDADYGDSYEWIYIFNSINTELYEFNIKQL